MRNLRTLFLVLSFYFPSLAFGQGSPGNAGGFEIDGNFYSGDTVVGVPSGLDWSGPNGVLLQNAGISIPGTDTFDGGFATWIVDGNWRTGIDSSVFGPSSNKNGDLIWPAPNTLADPWNWKNPGNGPQKNDLTNVMVYVQKDSTGPNATLEQWLVVGAETRATNGNSHLDIEYNQVGITQTGKGTGTGQLLGNGPHGGRTIGDLLLAVEYVNGGANPIISTRSWVVNPNGGGNQPGWIWSAPLNVTGPDTFITINTQVIPAVAPGMGVAPNGTASDSSITLQFVEAAVNLTALSISPPDPCNSPASVSVKTRTAQVYTSELKDFVWVTFPSPLAPIADAGSDQFNCTGASPASFTLMGVTQNSSASKWQIVAGNASIADPDSLQTLVTANSDTVIVELIAYPVDSSCAESRDTLVLISGSTVMADFSAANTCGGDSMHFLNLSSGPIANYFWDFGDGNSSTVANPSHLYAMPDTYQVTLVVMDSSGCSDTSQQQVVVYLGADAVFSAPHVCFGDTAHFIDLSHPGSSPITTYIWVFGDGDSSNLQNPSHYYATADTYTVKLFVIDANGCLDSVKTWMRIYAGPKVDFDYLGFCGTDSISFLNLSSGVNITQYLWDFGDGDSSSLLNPGHLYPGPGSYSVSLKVKDGTSCMDSISKTINVNTVPMAMFVATNTCAGDSTHFLNQSQGNIASYTWYFGDGDSSNLAQPFHSYALVDTYLVQLIVVDSNSCADTTFQQVIIYPGPTASFTYQSQCGSDTVSFVQTSVGSIALSFWDFGDGDTSSLANPMHVYPASGTYNVNLTVIDSNGCTNMLSQLISVNTGPQVSILGDSVCEGDTVFFKTISQDSLMGHIWSFGDGDSSFLAHPSHLYTSPGTYMVRLVVQDSSGCGDTTSTVVEVYQGPLAVFSAPSVCDGDSTRFVNLSIPGADSSLSYYWDFGDNQTDSTSFEPVHYYNSIGSYWANLLVLDSLGCQNRTTGRTEVFAPPTCAIQVPDSMPRCGSSGNMIQADSLSMVQGLTFQWVVQSPQNDWDTVTGANASILTYDAGSDSALFILTVSDSNGCQSVCSLAVSCRSNRPPLAPEGDYLAHRGFPNPFYDETTIELVSSIRTEAKVELVNLLGHKIAKLYEGRLEPNESQEITLDGKNLPEGLYYYHIKTDNAVYAGKLLHRH